MGREITLSLVLLFLITSTSTAQDCVCPLQCTCESATISCVGLSLSPCVQSSTTELLIKNSPNLTSLDIQSNTLTRLTITNTGIQTIGKNFLDKLPKLQTLSLYANANLSSVDLTNDVEGHPLTSLEINNSTEMTSVPRLEDCGLLTKLDLSSCGIQRVCGSDLEDLDQLRYLDLSHNHDLAKIDRDAFGDLSALEEIHFDHCDLRTLYSDYFDEAYDSGSLRLVTGLLNPYECLSLCGFIRWSDDREDFWSYSVFGTCTISYTYSTSISTIYGLSEYYAGCSTALGIILGITFGSIFFLCIVGCLLVLFCGIDWRKYCCFCCESQRNRNNAESGTRSGDMEQPEVHYDSVTEKAGLNTMGPGMYAAAPPSYEDITKADDGTRLAHPSNEPSSSSI